MKNIAPLFVVIKRNAFNMASPIKRLFGPKILSPIAAGKQKSTEQYRNSPIRKNLLSANNLAKKLTFQVSSNSFVKSANCSLAKNTQEHNINIKITDYSQESLLINTPTKIKLMKNGLSSSKNLKLLGKGSFGTVVRGIHKGIDVAVKIIKLKGNNLSSFRDRNALYLNHENVTKVMDVIHRRNTNYGIIVMEYLNFSWDLQSVLDNPTVSLNEETVVRYGLDICQGLHYCHGRGILHLDVKPSNILVCEDGLCKLCDFGNSVKLEELSDWNAQQCTVAYAAPEILLGKPPTTKCDVYSLGILLWQMKYRELPYKELDNIEVAIYRVVKFGYRPNISVPSSSEEYDSIYINCWAENPIDRPQLSSTLCALKNILIVI